MDPIVLTQLAMGLGVLARAALVKSVVDQKTMTSPFLRCPSSDSSNSNNQSFPTFHSLKTLKPTTATTAATATSISMAWADLSLLFFFFFFFLMIEKSRFVLEYIYECLILIWMRNLI